MNLCYRVFVNFLVIFGYIWVEKKRRKIVIEPITTVQRRETKRYNGIIIIIIICCSYLTPLVVSVVTYP